MAEALKGMSGVLIDRALASVESRLEAIKYARTHDGSHIRNLFGYAVAIEFARNVLGYTDREMDEKTLHNVIDIMEEQKPLPIWVVQCVAHTSVYCKKAKHLKPWRNQEPSSPPIRI